MARKVVKIIFLILIFQFTSILPSYAENTYIQSINTTAVILPNGDMNVTQIWNTVSEDGSEWFIPVNNLNHMELINFKVYELEYGKAYPYKYSSTWDSSASLEAKAHKYSDYYNPKTKMRELCFGKGEYGPKTFMLTWTYKNAVVKYTDNVIGFHINFINKAMNVPIYSAELNIYVSDGKKGYKKLNNDNVQMWSFGYDGRICISKAYSIFAETNKAIDQKNGFMSVLARLDSSLVSPKMLSSTSFEKQKGIAFKNSSYVMNIFQKIHAFFILQFFLIIRILLFIISRFKTRIPILRKFFIYRNTFKYIKRDNELRKKIITKSINEIKKTKYKRGIPLNGNLLMIQGMLELSQFENFERTRLIDALILRLLKKNFIRISEGSPYDGLAPVITFTKNFENDDPDDVLSRIVSTYYDSRDVQNRLYFTDVAKSKSPIKKEIRKILKYDDLLESLRLLKEHGYVYWNSSWDATASVYISDKGMEALKDIYGLYNYLKDFTIVAERDFEDIALWDEYLIMSSLFGISLKLSKELDDINPDYRFANCEFFPEDYVIFSFGYSKYSYYPYDPANPGFAGEGGSSSLGGGAGASGAGFGGGSR
jgi:hypothetical protein